ncbi:MAG: response regulator transcription factor [Syntrophothermus sp.]|nr:response regulator transcription factor [Syntrophothermus sp.]
MAQRLHLSPLTVKTYCQNTYEKLNVSSISELRAKLGW